MRNSRFAGLVMHLIAMPFLLAPLHAAAEDDWAAARKATCQELVDAYRTTSAAEKKVVAALKDSKDGTVAANALGVASLAAFGIGFFSWNDNSSAEENLADLREDLNIIRTVSAEKKCELPADSR